MAKPMEKRVQRLMNCWLSAEIRELQTWSFPFNCCCRCLPTQSVWRLLSEVGVTGRHRRTAFQKMGIVVEKAY